MLAVWPLQQEQDVYNITVEGRPEYFANGILVHNCLKYWASDNPCYMGDFEDEHSGDDKTHKREEPRYDANEQFKW